MSYCRWSECDVYAYDSCEGGVRFYVAGDDSLNRLCGTYNEAYQYAKELRDKHGLNVPSYAIDALREDAIDEAKRYLEPDSAVAELISENAKLRELVQEALASHEKMCTQRGNCFGCQFFDTKSLRACPIVTINRSARKLGIEVKQ